ncbi:YHS domain-containing (seleno)protein [Chromatocurvus halotolerans]|uniref:YHS domain-containing protein n=1 Tax=Chromatocurvus halotolerans TaxID=1132028 RepID=A0A4R2L279_9GAMM|nr:YHS domain-containing (seleno)protein [Chromatocurvus halotolerans]TCO77856.1 hypothetical protein EV688_102316 [Chromatocurvus halotolerans]
MQIFIHVFLALSLALLGGAPVNANDIAIEGYSPVSYFTKDRAEKGHPRFAAIHNGKIYYLRSSEQMATFNQNPEKYVPALGAHCPYSLALGRDVAVDPERFKLIDGRLYLFHKSEELDALRDWNNAENQQELLERAEGRFELFNF